MEARLNSGEPSFERLVEEEETEINLFDNVQPKCGYTYDEWKKAMLER